MESSGAFDLWLKRAVLILLAIFLAGASVVVWRVWLIAVRLEEPLLNTAADVNEVTATAAHISRQVDKIGERLADLEQEWDSLKASMGVDEVASLLDSAADLRRALGTGGDGPSREAEREIDHLFGVIRGFDHEFACGDRELSPLELYVALRTKYQVYRKGISSAEQFVDDMATKTVIGNPYRVVFEDGEKRPLNEWLREALESHRGRRADEKE